MKSEQVAVLGAGLMGHGIALVFAAAGHPVRLYDVGEGMLEVARERIRERLEFLGGCEEPDAVLARIRCTTDLGEAVSGADFVVEAAPEDLGLKRDLFRKVGELAPAHAILASNTSTLSVTAMGEGAARPENHVIAHWFNPPYLVPVVEVVAGQRTSEVTLAKTFDLLRSVGRQPVRVKKEVPGFVVNRLQTALFREALALLEAGVVDPEDLDRAVRGSFGLRLPIVGPLATADMGGLALWCRGASYLYPYLDNSTEPQRVLRDKVEAGRTGTASGAGFFEYGRGAKDAERARDEKLLKLVRLLGAGDDERR